MLGQARSGQSVTPDELNNRCIQELEIAGLQDGKYVAVVGSGPSSPYIPSVKRLVARITEVCGIVHDSSRPTWDFFESAFNHDEEAYCHVIRESFGMTPFWTSRTYEQIVGTPFASFVTLNYEDQLPDAFRKKYPTDYSSRFSVYPIWPNLRLADPCDFHRQHLVAIHGYRNEDNQNWPRNIILKTSDYNRHYLSAEFGHKLFSWWKELLASYPCIFIGTSLSEPGVEAVVKNLLNDQNPRFKQLAHLHLIDVEPLSPQNGQMQEPIYPDPKKTFGVIKQLQFDRIDMRFFGLLNILAHFSGIPIADPKPGLPALEPITVTNPPSY